jgi:prevent-host-death family protein
LLLVIVTNYGYNFGRNSRYDISMDYSMGDAKNLFTKLVRTAEAGEQVTITRHGKVVAKIVPPTSERCKARLGGMRGRVEFLPGWDDPVDEDRFLAGEL